jgi:cell division septation protein DedD
LGHEAPVPQPVPAPHHQQPAQDFYEADADFMGGAQAAIGDAHAVMSEAQAAMGEAQVAPEAAAKAQGLASKFSLKNRSVFMVGSALLGAIALGGALAVAYKQSGGGMGSDTPLVQADARPVKEAPAQPGGKEFPHKNKLIYDRLQNGDQPETERLVPRQEELALPAMPGVTAGLPQQVATAGAPIAADPAAVASVDEPAADGGPRRVKTLMVRPDGTVVPSAPGAAPAAGAPAAAPAAPPAQAQAAAPGAPPPAAAPQQAAAAPEQVAAIPQAQPAPKPKPAPKPAAKKAPSSYVVQVGSRKNQTEALATFADMQQKYPSLLGSYRPMVQKADLGSKGVWYRLRIGPIASKSDASKLCSKLKSQGLPDCLVMAK